MASSAGQFSKYVLGHDNVKGLVELFYVDEELNVPSFFSVLLLLLSAGLLAWISSLTRCAGSTNVWKWRLLSLGFVYIAFDEAFSMHEKLIDPIRALLGAESLGIFYFAWVIPGIALVALLGVLFYRFVTQLPLPSRVHFLIAGSLYVGGSLGFELIGGRHVEAHGMQNPTYVAIATIEEALELSGLVVFVWALLRYCETSFSNVVVRFDRG